VVFVGKARIGGGPLFSRGPGYLLRGPTSLPSRCLLRTSIKVDWFSLKNGPHQLLSKRHHEADASSITCSASASEAVGSGDHAPVDPGLGTVRKTENMTEQVEYVVVGAGIVANEGRNYGPGTIHLRNSPR
jgi:hypothetical protein